MTTDTMDALAARAKAKREAASTNVRFVNDRGQNDEYSFATPEKANAFRAKLVAQGRVIRDDVKCDCVGNYGPNPECGRCGGSGCYTADFAS